MKTRSQTTLFIILGLIIIAVVVIVYQFKLKPIGKEEAPPLVSLPSQIQEIEEYVDDCLVSVSEDGAKFVGEKGGTLPKEEDYTITKAKEDLEKYISENLVFCTRGFEDFEGFTIKQSAPKTVTEIGDEKVKVDATYLLEISKEGQTFKLKDFTTETPIKLKKMYALKSQVKEELKKDPEKFCLSCLDEMAEEKNLKITIINYIEGDTVVIVSDESFLIDQMPYQVSFKL